MGKTYDFSTQSAESKTDTAGAIKEILSGRELVSRIKHQIDTNYFYPLKLSDFAIAYHINPNYLSELFNRQVGSNFVKYLTMTRIEKAKQYLRNTGFSTETIADLIGYNDRGYFSRIFSEYCHSRPSEYRREFRMQTSRFREEYVYVAIFRNDPLMIEQDMYGLQLFAMENNVKAIIEAPAELDIEFGIHIFDDVINRHPAGIMVCAYDPAYIDCINKAIRKGIPTITVDCDVPTSNRIATVSSNWNTIGETLADELASSLHECGKVAVLDMSVSTNMKTAYAAFRKTMDKYPNINVLGEYDDYGNVAVAEQIIKDLLREHPDLAGITGFDSRSAIGACSAIRKAGLRGQVKVTSVDMTSAHLSLLRDGYIDVLLGQKRALFTYYGGKLLYQCNHSQLEISKHMRGKNIYNVPSFIDTGLIKITRDNLDEMFEPSISMLV